MNAPAEDRRAAIRASHKRAVDHDSDEYGRDYTIEYCSFCENDEWPCDHAWLLSELEAARAALEREREANRLLEQGAALAESRTREENARLAAAVREASDEVVRLRDQLNRHRIARAREVEAATLDRDQRKEVNEWLAVERERLIAERDTYRDLAKELYDDDPCSFDHHGGCQTHLFLEPGPGETCPDGRAQRLFEEAGDAE